MALVYLADTISEMKLGNGTSVLIFANIASALPSSVTALSAQNEGGDPTNLAIYLAAFFLTTTGIIYVQVRPASGLQCPAPALPHVSDFFDTFSLDASCLIIAANLHMLVLGLA